MVQHLCKNFLADAAEYESAEARWRRLWDRIVAEEKREAEWQVPWFAPEFANGTPMRDGNPIFSAVSPTLRRAVRIIQHEPSSDELELEYWLDTFQGEEAVSELVILLPRQVTYRVPLSVRRGRTPASRNLDGPRFGFAAWMARRSPWAA